LKEIEQKARRGFDPGHNATADAVNSGKLRLSAAAAQFAGADFPVDSGEFRNAARSPRHNRRCESAETDQFPV